MLGDGPTAQNGIGCLDRGLVVWVVKKRVKVAGNYLPSSWRLRTVYAVISLCLRRIAGITSGFLGWKVKGTLIVSLVTSG